MDRRKFLATTLAAGGTLATASTSGAAESGKAIKIVGISCSPRKGKNESGRIEFLS